MPGTDQTEFHGKTIEVQTPKEGTWGGFLEKTIVRANHINSSDVDITARIQTKQSDDRTYLDIAKEYFRKIYGPDDASEDYSFTKETVDDALNRTYVNGQPYKDHFGIGEIADDNYELAMCQFYYEMTSGSIDDSFQLNPPFVYGEGGPKKVTVFNPSGDADSCFTAVVPRGPEAKEKPNISGWKKFWNHFGFFKDDVQQYENDLKEYQHYVDRKSKYDENVKITQEQAIRMGQNMLKDRGHGPSGPEQSQQKKLISINELNGLNQQNKELNAQNQRQQTAARDRERQQVQKQHKQPMMK